MIVADGTLRTMQRCKVDKGSYQLICRDDRPYCFRAKLEGEDDSNKTFEQLYPSGLTIRDRKAVAA